MSNASDIALEIARKYGDENWTYELREEIEVAIMAAVAEEREACAEIIDSNMLCGSDLEQSEVLLPRGNSGNKVGFSYASAIRNRSNT